MTTADAGAPTPPDDGTRGPLAGLTVIELGGMGPGAFACLLLADLGAEVIRIDRPGGGAGAFMPPRADLLNRGKRSVVLDLKHADAVAAVLDLVATADVLVEGYRPGVAERLGLGPTDVWAVNPRLVYGRMTGWGQDGPLADRAGHDIDYIAVTGVLHAIGDAGNPPQIPLSLAGDFGGGATYLALGILAALLERQHTGRGQVVDGAIVDGASHLLIAVRALLACGRWTDERGVNLFDGGCPFYAVYETADGRHVAVGALEPQFYAELLRVLDLPLDPREQYDRSRWPALRATLAATFRQRTRDAWVAVFERTDACVAPVLSVEEAPDHPQLRARGTVIEVDGVRQPAPAPRFSGHRPHRPAAPADLGRDTRELLARIGRQALIDRGIAREA